MALAWPASHRIGKSLSISGFGRRLGLRLRLGGPIGAENLKIKQQRESHHNAARFDDGFDHGVWRLVMAKDLGSDRPTIAAG